MGSMMALKPDKTNDEKLLEMAKELPEVPSFYKYRDIAKIMMDHGMFIKSSKGLQWQIDDLALKLEHCKVLQIPMTWANSLYIGNGKFGMEIDLMSWIVRTQCPDAQFILDHGDERECVILGRRTLLDPNSAWKPFRYTIEMAQANNLIRGSNWTLNPSNMLNKNAYANAYRGLCRAELQNSYIKEEIGADEETEGIQKNRSHKKIVPGVPLTGEQIDDLIETLPPSPPQPKKSPELAKPENIPLGDPRTFSPEDLAALDKTKNFLDEPMTIEQTVDMTKELLGKKKTTKKADIIKKEPRDPLAEIQKMGEELAKIPRDSFGHPIVQRELDVVDVGRKVQKPLFDVGTKEGKAAYDDAYMKWLSTMAVADGFYIMKDAKVIGKEGNNRLVFRNGKQSWIDQKLAYDDPDGGVLIAASWLRNHGGELF